MEFTDNAKTGDLLAEISRLEDQVSRLSLQLDANNQTIALLKQTLLERDSRINELEANLVMTPKFLLQNVQQKIHRYKCQIKNGVDGNVIHPALTQIRQQMQLIQQLTDETRNFISKSRQVIQQHFETASAAVSKSPEQARIYMERNIIEPMLSLIHQVVETSNNYIKTTRHTMAEKIVSPSMSLYDQAFEAILALPSQGRIILQIWLVEPALHNMHRLSDFGNRLSDNSITELQKLLLQIKKLMDQGFAAIAEQVKNSPFWDGKRNIEAMT